MSPSPPVSRIDSMTIAAGIELPESAIADICRRHQVKELSLFGSAARGEMRPDSDLDLLVDFLPGARPGVLGARRAGNLPAGRDRCLAASHRAQPNQTGIAP